eukprot:gnl/Carplike_NY0171/8837_a12285_211.p1 GENE.gnl/Carplike_NY0171/8837_a12285_211~~gnl/Carplike_NY0171/8837_a12285_211.p1  ORF type:complete len:139 (-),score=30.90 gnl/Carplike_NY0171/8837_a12285_211:252-668(-)
MTKSEDTNRAFQAQRALQVQLQHFRDETDRAKAQSHDIRIEMTRQAKMNQETLFKRIHAAEERSGILKEEMAEMKMKYEEEIATLSDVIKQKDSEIQDLQRRIEDLAAEFGDMLHETLISIDEKIQTTAEELEPMKRK